MKFQKMNGVKCVLWTVFLLMLVLTKVNVVKTDTVTKVKVEPYASIAQVGETFTVNITLNDVENLYGVEVTFRWNASILRVVSVDVRLGVESHLDGVLHEPVFIAENETLQGEGKYLLASTSHSEAPPFSGGGNILRITFNVTTVGSCRLDVEAKLADWPPPDRDPRISWPILHETIDGFFGREIKISAYPIVVLINDSANINGFIIPPLASVKVLIQYRCEEEVDWRLLSTVMTNEQGDYHLIWRPQNCGEYEIRAEALILGAEETSSTVFVTVKSPDHLMWVYISVSLAVTVALVITVFIFRKRIKKRQRQTISYKSLHMKS